MRAHADVCDKNYICNVLLHIQVNNWIFTKTRMKIVLTCLHLNNVLLSLACIIFYILSVAFDMLTVLILHTCTCLLPNKCFQCNLSKKDYFLKIFMLVNMCKWLVFHDNSRRFSCLYFSVFQSFYLCLHRSCAHTYVYEKNYICIVL